MRIVRRPPSRRLAESERPSTRLRTLAALFTGVGAIAGAGSAVVAWGLASGWAAFPAPPRMADVSAATVVGGVLTACTWMAAGRLLARRRRRGGVLALGALALPLLAAAMRAHAGAGAAGLLFEVACCVVLASVWHELE
jgi:ABC-type transport system involved in cytochrome c biogenesis permease subunit